MVCPGTILLSAICTRTGAAKLMRTCCRVCRASRATATHTLRITMLNDVHSAFVMIVPGCVPSHSHPSPGTCRKRGITISSPSALKASSTMNGCAIRASKNVCVTRPPLLVTLNFPALGLNSAVSVGSRMYGESTVS